MKTWQSLTGKQNKYGECAFPTFKQQLVIAEMIGQQAGHPSEVLQFADNLYEGYDMLETKQAFIQIGVDAWENANAEYVESESYVSVYKDKKDSNVIYLNKIRDIDF